MIALGIIFTIWFLVVVVSFYLLIQRLLNILVDWDCTATEINDEEGGDEQTPMGFRP